MVPKRLRKVRNDAGLSQEKLAELLEIEGINIRARISNYELGRAEPPFNLVKKIAKIFDLPTEYFYAEDDDFALTILELYRNRMNLNKNPHYNAVIALKKLTLQVDDAKKLIEQLNECFKT